MSLMSIMPVVEVGGNRKLKVEKLLSEEGCAHMYKVGVSSTIYP